MKRSHLILVASLMLATLLSACSGAASDSASSPLPTASAVPAQTLAVPSVVPLVPTQATVALPTATPEPVQLVVLHTNDNWGETEPCG
jgi:hypothetical protein